MIKDIHIVYFLGIGGIGMSALARWFNHNEVEVYGYDLTPSPITERLQAEGIEITFKDTVEAIPAGLLSPTSNTLIIYTPAIPKDHPQLVYFSQHQFQIKKRAEVLGMITASTKTIAVAGTHGKTTTSSMIAHILKYAYQDVNAFVGGVMTNYESNLLIGSQEAWTVVEADEFDRSFLQLHPNMAVITAMDADHLDIYGSADSLKNSFMEFIDCLNKTGHLFVKEGLVTSNVLAATQSFTSYSLNIGSVHASNIRIEEGVFVFDITGEYSLENLRLNVSGFHNVENAVAAIAVALTLGIEPAAISEALANYKGVKRRFEYIIKNDQFVFIDDYAHHPTEIEALLGSVRAIYPEKKITAVFQPHLYSRTRDFLEGFADALSKADEVILLDIYPAREKPIEGVNSEKLLTLIQSPNKSLMSKTALLDKIGARKPEVLLTIGAGDIDRLVGSIAKQLNKEVYDVES